MANTAIADKPTGRMTREEYRAWVEQQPRGRFERINGFVVARDGAGAMAPERAIHNDRKMVAWLVLRQALRAARLDCHIYGDGMTVEFDDNDYEPDAIVRCGVRLPPDAVAVPDPLIIVEVLSPSSRVADRGLKFAEYFKLPSLRHYLIVWPDKQQIVHHFRNDQNNIDTTTAVAGEIKLNPPGIMILVEDIYAE